MSATPKFCWYELMTTDQAAAETFYRSVVGWTMADAGQPHMRYTLLSTGAEGAGGVGGIMTLPEQACAQGVPPAWMGYVEVPDTDAAAKRIVEAGGAIHHGPDDIPNVGRFAVVADPGGAVFQLLTPKMQGEPPPPPAPTTTGVVSWHELYAGQGQERAFEFYQRQFGWQTIELMDMGPMGKYRIWGIDGVQKGGMMDKPKEMPAAVWAFYVNVQGIDAAIERIKAGGGQILMGPHEVPGGSWIVQALDPQGANFALVSPTR